MAEIRSEVWIIDPLKQPLASLPVHEEFAEIKEGRAGVLKEHEDRVPKNAGHLVAPGGREAAEDAYQVRSKQGPLKLAVGFKDVPGDRVSSIRWIKENGVREPLFRDATQEFVCQVALRIKN